MRVLIAGGGVAGAAAASLLGPGAVLVERVARAHDKICGEFVSGEALALLERLGIDAAALGAAPIASVRVVHAARVAQARLPFRAAGLTRRALDAALLQRAAASGAELVLGETVRRLAEGTAEVSGAGRMSGHAVFLATGKHDLHGMRRIGGRGADRIGLKMYLRLAPEQAAALTGSVEVILFPGGYGGMLPVEGGAVNLCVVLDRSVFAAAGETWAGVQSMLAAVSPHCACRLSGAAPLLDRPLAIARVPYGFVHRGGDAVFRLGDQMAVIPSFCGNGIAMALHSAFSAADAAHRGADPVEFHRRLRRELSRPVRRATAIDRIGHFAPGMLAHGAQIWPAAIRWAAQITRVGCEAGKTPAAHRPGR